MVTTGQSQSETITISNPGGQPLTINQAALGGANASEFSIVSGQDNCSGRPCRETAAAPSPWRSRRPRTERKRRHFGALRR